LTEEPKEEEEEVEEEGVEAAEVEDEAAEEAHKGSRANHNRRDARAKKMARGGFAG
jgi:hypothetical protein